MKSSNIFNRIIKEEVQNFVGGGSNLVSDSKLNFQQVVNADFYNYDTFSSDYDTDIATTPITVNWSIKLWVNKTGVASFGVEIDSVEGFYVLNLLDKQSDQVVQNSQKNIADVKWHFDINNIEIELGESLYVTTLDFDFKNQACAVSF